VSRHHENGQSENWQQGRCTVSQAPVPVSPSTWQGRPLALLSRLTHSATAAIRQAKTSGQSNLTKGRTAAAHGRFNRVCQVAQACSPCNTCFPGRIQAHGPNGISIGSAILAQVMAQYRWACPGMPFRACPLPLFLQITHSHGHMGRSGSPSNMWFLLVHQSPQHKHLHWFSRFCAPQSVHIIYNGLPFSHHNCHFPFLWGIWTHLHVIHGFIRGVSALEVLRLCAIQTYILLTYLLS